MGAIIVLNAFGPIGIGPIVLKSLSQARFGLLRVEDTSWKVSGLGETAQLVWGDPIRLPGYEGEGDEAEYTVSNVVDHVILKQRSLLEYIYIMLLAAGARPSIHDDLWLLRLFCSTSKLWPDWNQVSNACGWAIVSKRYADNCESSHLPYVLAIECDKHHRVNVFQGLIATDKPGDASAGFVGITTSLHGLRGRKIKRNCFEYVARFLKDQGMIEIASNPKYMQGESAK